MILYLDCFSGASGDMLLGALIDLGLDSHFLEHELEKLKLPEHFHLHTSREERHGISGIRFQVHDHDHGHDHGHHHPHEESGHSHGHSHSHDAAKHDHDDHHSHGRTFSEIRALIEASELSPFVKTHAVGAFRRLAEAEGKIHHQPPETVTFHEVGALDSIIDTVGVCIGMEKLGISRVLASPLIDGTGFVKAAHGMLPIPVPATLECLKGIPLRQVDEPHELITPTGATLLAEFVKEFVPLPPFQVRKIGYGVGTRKLASRPNVVRAILAEIAEPEHEDQVEVLETQVDDSTGEQLGHVMEKLFTAGALDVFFQAAQMKKNRPGTLITVIAPPEKAKELAKLLMTETSAFGVRHSLKNRWKLAREILTVQTPFGPIQVKKGSWEGKQVQWAPEYESCRLLAEKTGRTFTEIYQAAVGGGK